MGCSIQCWCGPDNQKCLVGCCGPEEIFDNELDKSMESQQCQTLKAPDRQTFISSMASNSPEPVSQRHGQQSGSLQSFELPQVLCEGQLVRFKPGLIPQCIERWCELSNKAFAYFKSRDSAVASRRPLEWIPLSQIKAVSP